MAANITDEGLLVGLQHIVGQNTGIIKVRLFRNNVAIADNTQLADIQECDFQNYAPVVASGIFNLPLAPMPVAAVSYTPTVIFQQGAVPSNQNVFGYYLTQDVQGVPVKLIAIEKFPNPILLQQPNQPIRISVGASVRRRAG